MNFRIGSRFETIASLLLLVAGIWTLLPPAIREGRRAIDGWRSRSFWNAHLAGAETGAGDPRPVAWLELPGHGLEALVVRNAPGMIDRFPCLCALPGVDPEVNVIVAHRDKHFRPLKEAVVGDECTVTWSRNDRRTYRVFRRAVTPPERVGEEIAACGGKGLLVLVTCHPIQWVGPAPDRLLVMAREVPSAIRSLASL